MIWHHVQKWKISPFNAWTVFKLACVLDPSLSLHAAWCQQTWGAALDDRQAKKKGALVSRMLYLGAFPLARCLIPITGAGEQSRIFWAIDIHLIQSQRLFHVEFLVKWAQTCHWDCNVIMSNLTPYRNHWAEHTAETYTNIFYHDAIVRKTGNFQQTVLLWWCGRVYQDAVDIFGNCCFIDAFWQFAGFILDANKAYEGLQVKKSDPLSIHSFITILVLFTSGPDGHIGDCGFIDTCWQLLDSSWMHIKAYKGTASGSKQIHQLFRVFITVLVLFTVCSGPDWYIWQLWLHWCMSQQTAVDIMCPCMYQLSFSIFKILKYIYVDHKCFCICKICQYICMSEIFM